MAILEDASSPAAVTANSGTSLTTASFSPPANSVVVALAGAGGAQFVSAPVVTLTDSGGHTWTTGASALDTVDNYQSSAFVFWCYFATAPGPITLTASFTGTPNAIQLAAKVLTGASSAQNGATASATVSGTTSDLAITTTQTGSVVYGCSAIHLVGQSWTPDPGTTLVSGFSANGMIEAYKSSATGTPGSKTVGGTWSASTGSVVALFEVLPAPPTANASASLPSASSLTATVSPGAQANMSASSSLTAPLSPGVTAGMGSVMSSLTATPMLITVAPPAPSLNPARGPLADRPPDYWLAVVETITGRLVGTLPFNQQPQWSRTLLSSGPGALQNVVIPLFPQLDDDMKQRLMEPWRWTLAFCWGDWICQAGMLKTVVPADDGLSVTLTCATMGDFFTAKRPVVYPGHALTDATGDVVIGPASPDPANQNLSLHSAARRLVEIATSTPQLALPIDLPPVISGTAQFYWTGSDLAYVGQRLDDITKMLQGPEIEFDPYWVDGTDTFMRTRMRIGNYRLGQIGFPHAWDEGAAAKLFRVGVDGTDMTHLPFVKGQDNRGVSGGILVWAQPSFTSPYPASGWPQLWTTDTAHLSIATLATVQSYADQLLTTHQVPMKVGRLSVAINGLDSSGRRTGSPSIDLVAIGDTGFVGVRDNPQLANGQYGLRILQIEGEDAATVKITPQVLT